MSRILPGMAEFQGETARYSCLVKTGTPTTVSGIKFCIAAKPRQRGSRVKNHWQTLRQR